MTLFRRMLPPYLVLFAIAALLATGAAAQEESPSDDCKGGVKVEIAVVPDQEPLKVSPESVTIYRNGKPGQPGRVCWRVSGLQDGETLHIAGKEDSPVKDPFPSLERTITAPRDRANSGAPAKLGTWTYDLWITVEGSDERLHFTDPEVIISDGQGG